MIDGTEKPKIPSKFAKRAARYNEFRCKSSLIQLRKYIRNHLVVYGKKNAPPQPISHTPHWCLPQSLNPANLSQVSAKHNA